MAELTMRQRAALWAWSDPGGMRSDLRQLLLQQASGIGVSGDDPTSLLDIGRNGSARPIQPGRCATFDGLDDWIDCGSSIVFTTRQQFTFGGWIKITSGDNDAQFMCNASTAAAESLGWQIRMFAVTGEAYLSVGNGTVYVGAFTGAGTVPAGTWVHVMGVYDGAGNLKAYVNGALNFSLSTPAVAATAIAMNAYPLSLGTLNAAGTRYHLLTGSLFDVRIYDRALLSNEIAAIYNTTRDSGLAPESATYPGNLVAHWKLDDPSHETLGITPTAFFDASGLGRHAAANGGVAISTNSTVPCSWQNESGYTKVQQSSFAGLSDLWTSKFASWVATGANSTALTNQSWGGTTGLKAAKFTNGAAAGYATNRVDTSGGGTFNTPINRLVTLIADIATSRPLVSGEQVIVLFTGGTSGPAMVLGPNSAIDQTKFQTYVGSVCTRSAAYQQYFVVFPATTVTGGDLTIYVTNIRYVDLNYPTTGTVFDSTDRYFSNIVPQLTSVPSKDAYGDLVTYTGPVKRNGLLKDSHCGTFDGIDDAATAATISGISGAFSQAVWAYWMGSGTDRALFGRSASGSSGYLLYLTAAGKIALYSTSGVAAYAECNRPLPANRWVHVAATWDGTVATIYLDGVLFASTLVGSLTNPAANPGATFSIGAYNSGASGRWNGRLLDVRLYNSALSANNVLSLYQGKSVDPMPVGHWPIQEGDGAMLYDVSGNGSHATLTGATLATFWGTRQQLVHRNITKGFRLSSTVKIPATANGLLAADGNPITNDAGAWHNQAETRIDFTGGVPTAPWADAARLGYSLPISYNFGDALPGSGKMRKNSVSVPGPREFDFQIL